jgi:protein SCO1
MLQKIETYFTSWRFPSFMLVTLALSWAAVMFMAFVPVSDSAWGAFAEDFKVWCFGYDPETGSIQWIYVFMFTINPLILALVIMFVWIEPLKEVFASPGIITRHALMAVMLVAAVSASFLLMFEVPGEEEFEFRADALRIALTPPDFTLINQHEETVTLSDFRDRVVVITSVYASCADTCPVILDQARNVLRDLSDEEREEVVLMAITMQPEKDTPDLLRQIARFYRLEDYNAHLLTGDVDYVNNILDRFNVARYERDGSADMDHANLFIIIDKGGKIAYRFTIGERQKDWMTQALRVLVDERAPERLTETFLKK